MGRKSLLIALLFVLVVSTFGMPGFAQEGNDDVEWNNNPEIFQVNREPAHATLMPYDTVERALEGKRENSPFYQSLNGEWKFHWSENPASRPVDFYETDYDDSSWDTITVPSSWQLEGYDYPIYTNITYPWTGYEIRHRRKRQRFTIRSVPTAKPSPFPKTGTDVKCLFRSRGLNPLSICG